MREFANFNFVVDEIIGDGNCLFRSLSQQRKASQKYHYIYRQEICDFIENNPDLFNDMRIYLPYLLTDANISTNNLTIDQMFNIYVNQMRKNSTYGDQACIEAFSTLKNVSIRIFDPKLILINTITPKNQQLPSTRIINLIHIRGTIEHFQSLNLIPK